ncbi:MAG: hypothetical protein WBO97_08955 [Tepidiformaceae bacterium]
MPRTRTGLGQGLEALVPPLREPSIATVPRANPVPMLTWEVATLEKRGKRRCVLTVAPSALLKRRKRRKLKASALLTLGALGNEGWELVALSGRKFFLKRPIVPADVE